MLTLPNVSRSFEVYIDASDFSIGGDSSKITHPVSYKSRKLNDTELRYPVHDKEIMTIVHCLQV